jgi:hypothetical protein
MAQGFLAYVHVLGGGEHPEHPMAPGGGASQGPGFPTHPIAPGGQPGGPSQGPGFPTHPIAPGGSGGRPDQGLPGQQKALVVEPPYGPDHPVQLPPPFQPGHPIVLPEPSPQGDVPAGAKPVWVFANGNWMQGVLVTSSGSGGGKPDQGLPGGGGSGHRPDQGLPEGGAQPKR